MCFISTRITSKCSIGFAILDMGDFGDFEDFNDFTNLSSVSSPKADAAPKGETKPAITDDFGSFSEFTDLDGFDEFKFDDVPTPKAAKKGGKKKKKAAKEKPSVDPTLASLTEGLDGISVEDFDFVPRPTNKKFVPKGTKALKKEIANLKKEIEEEKANYEKLTKEKEELEKLIKEKEENITVLNQTDATNKEQINELENKNKVLIYHFFPSYLSIFLAQ